MNSVNLNTAMFNLQGNKLQNAGLNINNINGSKTAKEEELMKAAQDFEAVFVSKFMEMLDKTVEKNGFMGNNNGEKMFKSMMYQEISKDVASNPHSSFGFAQQMYEQMKDRI